MIHRIVILFLFVCTFSFAQQERIRRLQHFDKSKIRYGFYLGTHQKGYSAATKEESPVAASNGYGFQLGIIADYNLTKNSSILLEPGILSSSSQISFGGRAFDLNNTYFTLPISLKLTTDRINNLRFFGTGGVSVNYNFNAEDNNIGNGSEDYDFSLRKTTLAAEISLGFNIYLPYFKLSPAIKGIYGLQTEFSGENTGAVAKTQGPTSLKARAILFSLTFQ